MKSPSSLERQIEKLLRREQALADFGTFAFAEVSLDKILFEAARVCAESLGAPFSKVCKFQQSRNDLLVVAGHGWKTGVVGYAISVADETSPQGRAFMSGQPQVCPNVEGTNTYILPTFYREHRILSTVDVLVATKSGVPFGVLEVDSPSEDAFDKHDITFLTGFANVLAEAVSTSERTEALRIAIDRMQDVLGEKEILSQELKHRVRNSLHVVYGLLNSEIGGAHDKDSLIAFRSIALRVMGLAEVFDHLLGVGMSKIINFGDYVSALCENLPQLYKDYNVNLTCSVEPVALELEQATSLGIVITELVSNAYLHAFPDHSGEIDATMNVLSGAGYLSVTDNGIGGYVEAETKRRGIGLVRRFVEQVEGTMSVRSDKGTTWTVNFPVPELPILVRERGKFGR